MDTVERKPVLKRARSCLILLCVVNLTCAVNSNILQVSLLTVTKELQGSTNEASWAALAYLLPAAVFQPLWIAVSAILGRRVALLLSLWVYVVSIGLTFIIDRFEELLLVRGLQGLSGGGLAALACMLTTELVPSPQSEKWLGVLALQGSLGSAVGPALGGAVAQALPWQWMFRLDIPVCLFALVYLHLSLPRADGLSAKKLLLEVDWIGFVWFAAVVAGIVVPLTYGGALHPWTSAVTLIPMLLGLILLFGFVLYNTCLTVKPIFRRELFDTRTSAALFLGATVNGALTSTVPNFLPLYFQLSRRVPPLLSSASVVVYALAGGIAALMAAIKAGKHKNYRTPLYEGWCDSLLALTFLSMMTETTPLGLSALPFVPIALRLGAVWGASSVANQNASSDRAMAAGLFSFFRSLGQLIGLGLGSAIFKNSLIQEIKGDPNYAPYASQWAQQGLVIMPVLDGLDGPTRQQLSAIMTKIYMSALRAVWKAMPWLVCLAGIAIAACDPLDPVEQPDDQYGEKCSHIDDARHDYELKDVNHACT